MKKIVTILLLLFSTSCILGQKVDFKKDLSPLIKAKDYSKEGASKAEIYIQQNSKPNGELTDNAVLLNYEKVYSTKLYLANCWFKEGSEKRDLAILEKARNQYKEVAESLSNETTEAEEGKKKTEILINEIVEFNKAEEIRKIELAKLQELERQKAELERQKAIQDSLAVIEKKHSDSLRVIQEQQAAEKQKIEDDFIKSYNESIKANPSLYNNQSGPVTVVKSFLAYAEAGSMSGMTSVCENLEDNKKRAEVGSYGVIRVLAGFDSDPAKAKNEFNKIKSKRYNNPPVYYLSNSTAIVLVAKLGNAKGYYIYVGKVSGSWKVLGMDDTVFLRGNMLSLDQKLLIEKALLKRAEETN